MRVGVIAEVESVGDPVLQDARAGGAIEFLVNVIFDYEAGYGDVDVLRMLPRDDC
jgi:hypothetical protein